MAPDEVARLAFRWLVVACQAATLLITWPLWQVHSSPPMLPAVPLPPVDLGYPLLLSLALILVTPPAGAVVHSALVLYALLIDQTRIQPEIISLVFLLWGTLPDRNAKTIVRAHLISLWLFAGINKLLSPGFLHGTAQWMLAGLIAEPPRWLNNNAGYLIGLMESGTGLLALLPRTRKVAAVAAFGLHTGILLDLSPIGHNWNQSVWPWNVALAFAGFALIAPWKASAVQTLGACRRALRPLVVLLVLAPLGFYVGVMDAYLAHNLYSSNVPYATTTGLHPEVTWQVFKVPLPPEHRLFEQFFRRTCRPGEEMVITDPRWWFRRRGLGRRHFVCSSTTGMRSMPRPVPQGSGSAALLHSYSPSGFACNPSMVRQERYWLSFSGERVVEYARLTSRPHNGCTLHRHRS